MKNTLIVISVLATAIIPSAYASTASEREFKRGYNDCLHGRYDQNQHGESYKKGCRSAEDHQKSQPTTASEREFERGYNDCLHGRYDQNRHGESYKKGCRSAEDHQKSQPAQMKKSGKAKISDLTGMNSIKAFDVMTSRGFINVDSISMTNTEYGIYYNAKTHQCVQLTNADGRVLDANEIEKHPNCK